MPTIDLHRFFDFRLNVFFAAAFLIKLFEGLPVMSFRIVQASRYYLRRTGKINNQLICVDRSLLDSVVCSQALTSLSFYNDKIQSYLRW